MKEDRILLCRTKFKNEKGVAYRVKVEVILDDIGFFDHTDIAEPISPNDLPNTVYNTLWKERYAEFAIDNFTHNAYMFFDGVILSLRDNVMETRNAIIRHQTEKGEPVNKHEAWRQAIKSLQSQADYVRQFLEGDYFFVGFMVKVYRRVRIDNEIKWVNWKENSLWGIDWYSYESLSNKETFQSFMPDILLDCDVTMTPEQLNELWDSRLDR